VKKYNGKPYWKMTAEQQAEYDRLKKWSKEEAISFAIDCDNAEKISQDEFDAMME